MSTQELEARALHLSRHQRARLAQKLIDSLDEEDEVEQQWAEEAERRYEELRSGTVEPVPAKQVFAEVRSKVPPMEPWPLASRWRTPRANGSSWPEVVARSPRSHRGTAF